MEQSAIEKERIIPNKVAIYHNKKSTKKLLLFLSRDWQTNSATKLQIVHIVSAVQIELTIEAQFWAVVQWKCWKNQFNSDVCRRRRPTKTA